MASIPAAKGFPSGLIPRYSPFVAELRGGSSCGNRYNVARQRRRGKHGRGDPGGAGPPQTPAQDPELDRAHSAEWDFICSVSGVGGGVCTSYPSCHRMFGFRQPWESSLRAPRSHRAQHLYILVCFIMTAGRPWGKFDTLCTMNFGFCLVVRVFIPKGLKPSDIKTAIALVGRKNQSATLFCFTHQVSGHSSFYYHWKHSIS